MVKKKQKPDTETDTVEPEKDLQSRREPTPQEAFMKQLQQTIEAAVTPVAEAVDKLNTNQQKQLEEIRANTRRINSVAKTATDNPKQDKGMNPMEILKTITDLLNSPVVKGLTDKMFGGEETPLPPAENPISPEERTYLLDIKKKNDEMQGRWMEALIKQQENIVAKQQKELESEW